MKSIISDQNSRLNSRQIEEARCYLSFVGNYCGANADEEKGCNKTVDQLLTIWKAEKIKQKKKICECEFLDGDNNRICINCKGLRRIQPVLLVNEKMGYGLDRNDEGKIIKYGNICYYCKSCQMLFDRRVGDSQDGEKTWQAIKCHQVRPMFKNDIKDFLAKNVEICYKFCINRWSGSKKYNCSQDLLENAFDQELDKTLDLIDITEYGIECKYKKCNGNHIILKNHPPIVKTAYDTFLKESETED